MESLFGLWQWAAGEFGAIGAYAPFLIIAFGLGALEAIGRRVFRL